MVRPRSRLGRVPRPPRIPRSRLYSAKQPSADLAAGIPEPHEIGVGSKDEARTYAILRRYHIPFKIQVNFDGGSDLLGGQRADFVLPDRMVIIEILGGFWHDEPQQKLKDERKWERRRQDGWQVKGVRTDAPDFEQQVLAAAGRRVG